MRVINQQFKINYQYPVFFTKKLFEEGNPVLSDFLSGHSSSSGKVLFVLDEGMMKHYPQLESDIQAYLKHVPAISPAASFLHVPGGEKVKNEERYFKKVVEAVDEYGIDRHSFIVAIGGGSVLDMAGYAAAVSHRGIRHIRIPTTVLSQNDSGVGVKNGINYFGKKNFLGTFSPPIAVFNDISFLNTLDDRSWKSGISEAVKVALIKDRDFFDWLEKHAVELVNRGEEAMAELIYRCAALHLQHISSGDPFESGSSRPLDFGHWSAHKLEQLSGFSVLHGEAVAMGIALDVLYSREIGWLSGEEAARVLTVLQNLRLELFHPLMGDPDLLTGLKEFQEHLGGKLTIMLLKNIGEGKNIHKIDSKIMKSCIRLLKKLAVDENIVSKNSVY